MSRRPASRLLAPSLAATLATGLALTPALALADGPPSLFSAQGVPAHTGRVAVELGLLAIDAEDTYELPTIGVRYARNLVERLDLRLSLSTMGLYTDAEAGVGFAVVQTPTFGLGLRGAVTGVALASDGLQVLVAGTPGVAATVSGGSMALTVALDAPLAFGSLSIDGTPRDDGFLVAVRPTASLEVGAGELTFYMRGGVLLVPSEDWGALATVSSGVHF